VSAMVSRRLFVCISMDVLMACKSTRVSSVFSLSFLRRSSVSGQHTTGRPPPHVLWSPLTRTRWIALWPPSSLG
jgi:hypothetical protein